MSKRSTAQNKESEVLSSKVNVSGQGEDPVIRDMLSEKFTDGSNAEASEIGLALQALLRGQNSMLANQDQYSRELAQLRQRMDEMDQAARRWEEDREKFVQEVLDKAEKLRAVGNEKDKIIAQGANEFQAAIAKARAEQAVDHIKFEQVLAAQPKVSIVSPGELVMVMENGRQVAKIMNETVKIKHKKWVIPIGKVVEVPLVVAQVLEQRRRTQAETEAREKLLSANLESSKLDEKWKQLNSTFNSTTDTIPTI